MNNTTIFCDLEDFYKSYHQIHGYVSFFVCVFGSIANILNICVLTTKEMRWPTNLILTGLAVADLLVMLDYIPFTINLYIKSSKHVSSFSYGWAVFMLFHAPFTQICHFISCCLTVILAIWRYVIITNPQTTRIWCGMKRTLYVILLTYVLCPIICSPIILSLKIVEYNQTCDMNDRMINMKDRNKVFGETQNKTIYYADVDKDSYYNNLSFWVYCVVLKLLPCILLTFLSWRLISVLLETKKRRRQLHNSGFPMESYGANNKLIKKIDKDKHADRTSTMLLAVLLLFLITEFPQAILGLLSATIGDSFREQCYDKLGDVMDILALTNSAINFILYCTMSKQFRSTFGEVFRPKIIGKWMPLNHHSTAERNCEGTQFSQV